MAWNNHDMIAAISAVRDDKMSIAQAAREHCVPRKTLDHRIKNKLSMVLVSFIHYSFSVRMYGRR